MSNEAIVLTVDERADLFVNWMERGGDGEMDELTDKEFVAIVKKRFTGEINEAVRLATQPLIDEIEALKQEVALGE